MGFVVLAFGGLRFAGKKVKPYVSVMPLDTVAAMRPPAGVPRKMRVEYSLVLFEKTPVNTYLKLFSIKLCNTLHLPASACALVRAFLQVPPAHQPQIPKRYAMLSPTGTDCPCRERIKFEF